ncbi:unnamed protein product [Acidocella sp. C78]|uniref:phosphonate C-P lyase system protein PhnH n=1 Tax=Acidocella sp. C78 TaxID=1671486 RepID=UPI00191BB7A5|nr:phosphonate C-P lyase system protein PhnH [Acidocella sp. C78]CAG4924378.1 unnamed protein product [Acidocella sp. C78]
MTSLTPGFASPLDAQACFRALLTAFGDPGRAVTLADGLAPPAGLSSAAAAVLLTLADATTPLAADLPAPALHWLGFHTGAPFTTPETAEFCLAGSAPPLSSLRQGSETAPEHGATLILDLPDLVSGRRCRLSGPGLAAPRETTLPLPASFLADWAEQRRQVPRGVDVLLCAGRRLLALPRSLAIEPA